MNDEYEKIIEILTELIEKNDSPFTSEEWLNKPHNLFGGAAPMDLIKNNRGYKVLNLLKAFKEGY